MCGADRPGRIRDQDRDAVRRCDAEEQSGGPGPEGVRLRPGRPDVVGAHDGIAVHLRDPHDAVEAETPGEGLSVAVLLLEREGGAGHAAERAGRESADEAERAQRW